MLRSLRCDIDPRHHACCQLRAYDGAPESIAVAESPVPRPGPGQVLIRVAASLINPSRPDGGIG